MSDTPRSDRAEDDAKQRYEIFREVDWPAFGDVGFDFARQLERELNAANNIKEKAFRYASMPDSELRLRCGKLTAREIRTIRAVLNNILTP